MNGRPGPGPFQPGHAIPTPEPRLRVRRPVVGKRVGTILPPEMYVAFKSYVAREGITGEVALAEAVAAMLERNDR